MSEAEQGGAGPADERRPAPVGGLRSRLGAVDWRHVARRAAVWLLLAALVVILALLLTRVVPRWWGGVVGGLIHGSTPLGVWWGLFFGAVFTGIPLAVAWQAARPGRTWALRIGFLVTALVLTAPNLFTLSIILGTNAAAVAGERMLDADAPAFRAATAWGVVLGTVFTVAVLLLWAGYRRRGERLKEYEEGRGPD